MNPLRRSTFKASGKASSKGKKGKKQKRSNTALPLTRTQARIELMKGVFEQLPEKEKDVVLKYFLAIAMLEGLAKEIADIITPCNKKKVKDESKGDDQ